MLQQLQLLRQHLYHWFTVMTTVQSQRPFTLLLVAVTLLFILRYNLVTRWLVHCYHACRHCRRRRGSGSVFSTRQTHINMVSQVDAEYWAREYGIQCRVSCPSDMCGCFNCCAEREQYELTRARLVDYMLELEKGGHSRLERWLWSYYATHYPLWHSDLRIRGLFMPVWLITLVDLYNSVHARLLTACLLLYVAVVLSAPLWIGYVTVMPAQVAPVVVEPVIQPSLPRVTSRGDASLMVYNEALQRDVCDCEAFVRSPGGCEGHAYCVARRGQLWRLADYTDVDYTAAVFASKTLPSPPLDYYFTDVEQHVYRVYRTLSKGDTQPRAKLVRMDTLREWLESLRLHQQVQCVCPVFLGIVDNVTFLYDAATAQWLAMREPVVVRNETRGNQVASTLVYEAVRFSANPLYRNYKHYVDDVMRGNSHLRHYASYDVSYWSDGYSSEAAAAAAAAVGAQYEMYDRRLLEYDTVERCLSADDARDRSILLVLHRVHGERERRVRHLSGEQAICFNFCQHANKQFIQ
jgi:hypothetical protein